MNPRSKEARRQKLMCSLTCWAAAAFFTVVAFAALVRSDAWSFVQAVFASGFILLALGVVFSALFCRPLPAPVTIGARPAASPAPAPEATPSRAAAPDAAPSGQATSLSTQEDLQRIRGIGPKLAQTLAEKGVAGAAQIAAWTEQDVAWWAENLEGFRGRVSRDEWVAQAQALVAEDTAGGDAARKG